MFGKILIPLDSSEHSIRALEVVVQMALRFNGKITLIHACSIGGFAISATPVQEFIEATRKAGADILADGEKRVKAEGLYNIPLKTEIEMVEAKT
jgi:nucleotide-binding universal stress UspA family protein